MILRFLMGVVGAGLVMTGMGLMVVGIGMPILILGLGLFGAALENRSRAPSSSRSSREVTREAA